VSVQRKRRPDNVKQKNKQSLTQLIGTEQRDREESDRYAGGWTKIVSSITNNNLRSTII
jgi:hypothetical protein